MSRTCKSHQPYRRKAYKRRRMVGAIGRSRNMPYKCWRETHSMHLAHMYPQGRLCRWTRSRNSRPGLPVFRPAENKPRRAQTSGYPARHRGTCSRRGSLVARYGTPRIVPPPGAGRLAPLPWLGRRLMSLSMWAEARSWCGRFRSNCSYDPPRRNSPRLRLLSKRLTSIPLRRHRLVISGVRTQTARGRARAHRHVRAASVPAGASRGATNRGLRSWNPLRTYSRIQPGSSFSFGQLTILSTSAWFAICRSRWVRLRRRQRIHHRQPAPHIFEPPTPPRS
jgi:hypothetical protein